MCQRDFDDKEEKTELLTLDLQKAFQGIAVFETDEEVSFLCKDCYNEYLKLMRANVNV